MRKLWTILAALLLLSSAALAEKSYPIAAWTAREVSTYSRPEEGAQDGGVIAQSCLVTWLDTQEEWAYVDAQGMLCYVPVNALETDRVFSFDSHPTRSMDWPYNGEIRISPDGTVRIAIRLADEYADGTIFGGAELCCFEVVDALTGEVICIAEPDLSRDPVFYLGEGSYAQGTALRVVPVLRHDGYSVEIQW